MVIMELVLEYAEYADRDKKPLPFPQPTQVRTILEKAIHFLHSGGFVHGDVRDTNLLVKVDGGLGVLFVDFDWAGKAGEARYPMNVNRADIPRPEGARNGRFIRPEDDVEMIDIMF